MIELEEISRETYGRDHRAINRHHERRYRASSGRLYILSRTLDGCPPFFEAYGPFADNHVGVLPRLLVDGLEYWGDNWEWKDAYEAFRRAVHRHEAVLPQA